MSKAALSAFKNSATQRKQSRPGEMAEIHSIVLEGSKVWSDVVEEEVAPRTKTMTVSSLAMKLEAEFLATLGSAQIKAGRRR